MRREKKHELTPRVKVSDCQVSWSEKASLGCRSTQEIMDSVLEAHVAPPQLSGLSIGQG